MTQCIKIKHYDKVVLVTLNRPEALNALNDELRLPSPFAPVAQILSRYSKTNIDTENNSKT